MKNKIVERQEAEIGKVYSEEYCETMYIGQKKKNVSSQESMTFKNMRFVVLRRTSESIRAIYLEDNPKVKMGRLIRKRGGIILGDLYWKDATNTTTKRGYIELNELWEESRR